MTHNYDELTRINSSIAKKKDELREDNKIEQTSTKEERQSHKVIDD